MYAKDVALRTSNWEIFRYLINQGVDPTQSDYSGKNIKEYIKTEEIERLPIDIKKIFGYVRE